MSREAPLAAGTPRNGRGPGEGPEAAVELPVPARRGAASYGARDLRVVAVPALSSVELLEGFLFFLPLVFVILS